MPATSEIARRATSASPSALEGPSVIGTPSDVSVAADPDSAASAKESEPRRPDATGTEESQPAVAPAVTSFVTDGAVGVGTSAPLADLHVVGGPTMGSILLTPNEPKSNESSELFFGEDIDGTFGMKIKYDGTLGANTLEIWGQDTTGDLGPWLEIQRNSGRIKAAKWNPDPACVSGSVRFVNCGNGTVTDSMTGLIWLETAHCVQSTWQYLTAHNFASALEDGQCGLTDGSRPGDWRLPTKEEWEAVVDPACASGGPGIVGNGSSGGCFVASPWASDVAAAYYWSSTTYADNTAQAWTGDLTAGQTTRYLKISNLRVWPVRGGE